MQIKPAPIGSVSSGTLKTCDLLDALAYELEWQIRRNGDFFSRPENFALRDRLNALHGDALDCFAENGDEVDDEENAQEIAAEIADTLSEYFAPLYCYFGGHEGDPADFGYWPAWDAIRELPTVEDSDEARELGEDCKSVNDHGNVTVYGADGSVLLELV